MEEEEKDVPGCRYHICQLVTSITFLSKLSEVSRLLAIIRDAQIRVELRLVREYFPVKLDEI